MTIRTEEDVIDLWERTSDEYGSEFGDEYPLGEAIQHFRGHGYDFVLAQVIAIKNDIETERYHEMLAEEDEQDFYDAHSEW